MIKFVEIIVNPYDNTIEHCVEKASPIIPGGQLRFTEIPSIPVVVPPDEPAAKLPYIRKQFCVECDEGITAGVLRKVLDSVGNEMPTIKPRYEKEYKIGFLDYDLTAKDYNTARKSYGMQVIDFEKERDVVRPALEK